MTCFLYLTQVFSWASLQVQCREAITELLDIYRQYLYDNQLVIQMIELSLDLREADALNGMIVADSSRNVA